MRKRNNAVYVRFNDQEYEELLKRVEESGLTIQSYIIKTALGAVLTTKEDRENLLKQAAIVGNIDRTLRGIGINVNQMSRHANVYGQLPCLDELEEIKKEISDMRQEVNKEWQSIRQLISEQ